MNVPPTPVDIRDLARAILQPAGLSKNPVLVDSLTATITNVINEWLSDFWIDTLTRI